MGSTDLTQHFGSSGGHRRSRVWLLGLITLGLAIRLVGLNEGLWYDEIQTYTRYLKVPLAGIVTMFDSQNQHMLYSILGRISILIFGETAWAIRLPALAFGVASLWATYWFGCQIAARTESLLAVAFLALSYHHVWFSQNARGYTGLLFWTLLSTGFFLRLLGNRAEYRKWSTVGYVVTTALGAYTHLTAALVGVSHLLVWSVLTWRKRADTERPRWRGGVAVVLAGCVTLGLYTPALRQLLQTLLEATVVGQETEWRSPYWLFSELLQGLATGLPGGMVTVLGGAGIFVVGVWSFLREQPVATGLMLLPGVLVVITMLALGHNLWPRLFVSSAGFGVLLVMRGIARTSERVFGGYGQRIALVFSVMLIAGSGLTVSQAWKPKQDYLGALAFIESERRAGDSVVTVDMTRLPFNDYLNLDWLYIEDVTALQAVEARSSRTWLVYVFQTRLAAVHPDVWQRLETHYRVAASFPGTVRRGEVVVMIMDSSSEVGKAWTNEPA